MENEIKLLIDKSWSLFLDRDGVINRRLLDDYIKNWDEFEFLDGVLESLEIFSKIFGRIFIVTNQRGIARNLMTENDLDIIHKKMLDKIEKSNGKIDKIYYCPHDRNVCSCRKPATGMSEKAKKEFPEIDFKKSIMVGDSPGDMKFGENSKMINVFITTSYNDIPENAILSFSSLLEFAKYISKILLK